MSQIKIEYIEDEQTHKWLPRRSSGVYELVLTAEDSYAWCDYHQRWEKAFKDQQGVFHFSCGRTVLKPAHKINESKLSSILFKIDLSALRLDVSFRTPRPYFQKAKLLIDKKSTVSHFDLAHGVTSIEHNVEGEQIIFTEDLDIANVPEEIQEAIQHTLSMLSKRIYGVACKNTYKLCQNGFKHFVKFPSCPPIANVKPCFIHFVNRKSLHAFEDMCALFNIKPSKKFRKTFLDNPSALLVNIFLSCIGFKDANVFNRYYQNAALIRFLNDNLTCNERFPKMILLFGENKNMFALHRWYENASVSKSDIVCANHLIEPILSGRTDRMTMIDAFRIYVDNFEALPQPLKNRILREGFTGEVHDRMCEALGRRGGSRRANKEKVDIEYSENELKIEGKFVLLDPESSKNLSEEERKYRYYFELPKSTDDLYLISDKMHNCVGYAYRDSVINKKCLIVTLEDKVVHKGVACIEIVKDNSDKFNYISQALGPCNNRIEKEHIPVIQTWMRLHHLSSTISDLAIERRL